MIELLVAIAVLALLMVMIFSLLSRATDIWGRNTAKVGAFQEARKAFESMGRNLSQATLNPYWDYEYDGADTPTNYVRQSELHFVSGPAVTVIGSGTAVRPTGAVFFQAPLGFGVASSTNLSDALNACGYYIEFGNDLAERPPFLTNSPVAPRWRYRLMEMKQPTRDLELYGLTSGEPEWPPSGDVGNDWFAPALNSSDPPTRLLAENIIALIVLPKLDPRADPTSDGTALAPNYLFNSRQSVPYNYLEGGAAASGTTRNQLPPLMEITLVALDERSALRLADENGSNPPDLGLDSLFQTAANKEADLATLGKKLTDLHLQYRIFTTTVSVDSAKWSND